MTASPNSQLPLDLVGDPAVFPVQRIMVHIAVAISVFGAVEAGLGVVGFVHADLWAWAAGTTLLGIVVSIPWITYLSLWIYEFARTIRRRKDPTQGKPAFLPLVRAPLGIVLTALALLTAFHLSRILARIFTAHIL